MLRLVEGQSFNSRHIGQVEKLPQRQGADNDMQVLRWPIKTVVEMMTKIINRKSLEKMATKGPSPGSLQ